MTETRKTLGGSLNSTNLALGFIVVCLVVYILNIGRAILIPFVIAVFVWYLINAIARFLGGLKIEKYQLPRFLCFVLAILSLASGLWFIYELIGNNIAQVKQAAPVYQANFEKIIPKLTAMFHLDHEPQVRDLLAYIDLGAVMTTMAKLFTGIAGKALIVMFYVGFLLYEQRYFNRKIIEMIADQPLEDRVRRALHNIDNKVQRYIGVRSFVSFCDSVLTYLILSAFNVDFAGFWGLMAFFLHFIPYAGSFVAIVMPTLITLIQFGDPTVAFMVLACLCVSHAFLGHILDPYLMGNNLNLSPIFIISSIAMWGLIWGVPGMFLAIPILAVIAITLAQFDTTRPLAILLSKTGEIDPLLKQRKK